MNGIELPIEQDDDVDELSRPNKDLVVYSRDWTVQTIISQIEQGNIDLNPSFQRRNAWKDDKRLRLIESLLLKYPVPEIVLAERSDKKRSFIVIDGKQRLQTIAGLYLSETYNIWNENKFGYSKNIPELSKVALNDFLTGKAYSDLKRELDNSDIRCTIISNYDNEDILYDIFYRLNTGSTPLSSQELRQVLNKGGFSEYLISLTNTNLPVHKVLDIEKADDRLMDVDLVLRTLAFYTNGYNYRGSQKLFLDNYVNALNQDWQNKICETDRNVNEIMNSIDFLSNIINYINIGRKISNNAFDWRFNKMLFEVQVLYSTRMKNPLINPATISHYKEGLEILLSDPEFSSSIESSTKTIDKYKIRFSKYEAFINSVFPGSVSFTSPFVGL